MNCPKCKAAMKTLTVGEFEVERCTSCSGLWFDLREHEHIAESADLVNQLDSGDPQRGQRQNAIRDVQCPLCSVKMLKLSVPTQLHIKYESCPVCHGAYLDAGELKDYANRTVSEQVSHFLHGFKSKPTAS